MVKRLPFKTFDDIYSKVPRLCVDIIVKTKEGVVLSKRDIPPASGMWHIPGGTVLLNETHRQAVKRIARRELGLKVEVIGLVGVIEYSKKYSFGQSTAVVYLVTVLGGMLHGSKEGKDVRFFKNIPNNIIPEQSDFLNEKFGIKHIK